MQGVFLHSPDVIYHADELQPFVNRSESKRVVCRAVLHRSRELADTHPDSNLLTKIVFKEHKTRNVLEDATNQWWVHILHSRWSIEYASTSKEKGERAKKGIRFTEKGVKVEEKGVKVEEKGVEVEEKGVEVEEKGVEVEEKVVRSGRPNARQRRLGSRQEEISKPFQASDASRGTKFVGKGRDDFANFYLKYAESHDMCEDEQLDLWQRIRDADFLMQEQRRLKESLGYEPSMHQLAEAASLPVRTVTMRTLNGIAARKKMIRANMRLVVSVARRYENLGVDIADLIQEGTFGLVQGMEKFDVKRGFKFSTYAYWWIFQAMIRALDRRGKAIRYPFHLCETIRKISKLRSELREDGPLSIETIARELKMTKTKVEYAIQASHYRLSSLDRPVSNRRIFEGGDPLEEFMVDQCNDNNPWHLAEKKAAMDDLEHILETKLNARERRLIRIRYGLDPSLTAPLSRSNIGAACGISRERVRQVEMEAMSKLRACKESLSMDHLLTSSYQRIL